MKMTINDKLAKYVLDSLVESEEYSKNVKLPSGKPSASGRSKPKSAISTIKSSDDEEVDEEDLEEQQKMGKKARQNARRDYQTDREEMGNGIGWKERAENRKGHRRLSGMLKGAMAKMRRRNASSTREDSSTNWQDRIVDMLLEKSGALEKYWKKNFPGRLPIPKKVPKSGDWIDRAQSQGDRKEIAGMVRRQRSFDAYKKKPRPPEQEPDEKPRSFTGLLGKLGMGFDRR